MLCLFFFKKKTAYVMRISDWSSDVCSSDLGIAAVFGRRTAQLPQRILQVLRKGGKALPAQHDSRMLPATRRQAEVVEAIGQGLAGNSEDRKSVVEGKRVSVRVYLGRRRINKKKTHTIQ